MELERLTLSYNADSKQMFLTAILGTETVPFLIDTGASVSVLPFALVENCGAVGNLEDSRNMQIESTLGSYEPKILGKLKAVILCQGVEMASEFFVLDRCPPLLGLDFIMSYKSKLFLDPFSPFMEVDLHRISVSPDRGLQGECEVANRKLLAILDTGATDSLINLETAMALGFYVEDSPKSSHITIAGESELFGCVRDVRISFRGYEFATDLLVERSTNEITLGLNCLLGCTFSFAQR